jgi:hypothetical protein
MLYFKPAGHKNEGMSTIPPSAQQAHPAVPLPGVSGMIAGAAERPASDTHQRVAELTKCIFGRPALVQHEHDPECGDEYFRVSVAAAGSEEEVLQQYRDWHRRLPQAAGEFSDRYCLSTYSVE